MNAKIKETLISIKEQLDKIDDIVDITKDDLEFLYTLEASFNRVRGKILRDPKDNRISFLKSQISQCKELLKLSNNVSMRVSLENSIREFEIELYNILKNKNYEKN